MATCRDCPPGSKRPIKAAGRCATHHREAQQRRRQQAAETRRGKVYGLQPGEYDRIKEAQGGVCAICGRARGVSRALAVDHDHETGYVRGLLCSVDNKLLGHARDDVEFFRRAIAYLEAPPAQALGIWAKAEESDP